VHLENPFHGIRETDGRAGYNPASSRFGFLSVKRPEAKLQILKKQPLARITANDGNTNI